MKDLDKKIIELMDLFDDEQVTTADKIDPPENPYKEFEDRNPQADGGRIGFQDGTPIKFDKTRVKIPTGEFIGEGRDKSQIFKIKNIKTGSVRYTAAGAGGGRKKLYESIEDVKKAKLDFIPDELVKTDSKRIKENIQKITYKNKKTGKIVKKYKPFIGPDKVTIPDQGADTLKEAQNFVKDYFKTNPKKIRVRDPKKDYASKDVRKKSLKQTDPTGAEGTKKFNYHHIRQIAGGVPLTTDDVMIINQRINSALGTKYNKPLNAISAAIQKNNRLALEAMNAKDESLALEYMKRSDNLNAQAAKIVNSAIDKLPKKYKGYVGFNQFTLPRNEYGFPISNEPMIIKKVGGLPVSKNAIDLTTLNLKQEKEFKKIVKAQAEAGKVGQIKGLVPFMKNLGIKCQLSSGINCMNPQAYEKSLNKLSTKAQAGDQAAAAKMTNFAKSVRGAGGVIKGVLGPAAIAAEIGIAIPIGLFDYAQGKPKEEIINTLTYGLAGKDREDRLKEEMPTYGQGDALNKAFSGYLSTLNKLGMPRDPNQLRPGKKTDDMLKTFRERQEPFMRVNPQLEEGQMFDLDMFDKNIAESRALEQKLANEDLQRKLQRRTDPFTAYSDDFMAAGGGIAKLAGVGSGPPPESGPNSQGLQGLMKRVKNT